MRSHSSFSGLIKPIPGEALSSWLERGARAKNPLPFVRAISALKALGIADVDQPLTNRIWSKASRCLGDDRYALQSAFQSHGDWLRIEPNRRQVMCEYCLMDDFASYRRPSMRDCWFYWWFTICPVHGSLLSSYGSTSAAEGLVNALRGQMLGAPRQSLSLWRQKQAFSMWQMKALTGRTYNTLKLMAFHFQKWYMKGVLENKFLIGEGKVPVCAKELEQFMGDLIAVIGKKRCDSEDSQAYIAQILKIRSWSSLSSTQLPAAGCKAFLCFDIGEHNSSIRMAMFALLGLFIEVPACRLIWHLGSREGPFGFEMERPEVHHLWWRMLSEVWRSTEYLEWLKDRSQHWSDTILSTFGHLLAGKPVNYSPFFIEH